MKRTNKGFPIYHIPSPIQAKAQVILTNDPSIRAWGYAVIQVNPFRIVDVGCIKTESSGKKLRIRKGDDTVRRITEINEALLKLLDKYDVRYICSELPHGSQSASAAVMIGIVMGIMQTIADCRKISLEWFSEGDSKKCLLGKRAAIKDETKRGIADLYDVPWTNVGYKDEAIADAIAVYHVAKANSNILKFLNHMDG